MKKFSFLIVAIQILLLVNIIPAQSYIINQENFSNNLPIIENNSGNLINSISELTSLLMGFFAIKQIGIVSAEDINYNCCLETNNGAICQNIISGTDSSEPENCENPLPTSCEESSVCKLGTCIYNEGVSCAANSPMQECEENDGLWKSQNINELSECEKGVCVLGSELKYTTEKQCELFSASKGLETDFRLGFTELDFPEISGNLPEGACVLQEGNCRFVTAVECDEMIGNFYENFLCSNQNLETSCNPSEQTTCVEDQVYFTDSCGNPANVYDSSKINDSNYWDVISESGCFVDVDNPDSVKSCGNCNVFLSSQCSESSGENPDYGEYFCKDLRCKDEKGKLRLNGEKWCMYDGYIGNGKDTVGSEHWLAYCDNGELEVDMCGGTRGQVCAENVIEEGEASFSTASCVVNEALKCLDSNNGGGDCGENSQCQIKSIDVDEGFQFSLCVPKYPRGFDLKEGSDISGRLCSIANQECKVVYQKNFYGGWDCVQNCNCEKSEFAEQMNNLCVSLGDCGSYVNYIGDGTDNVQVENSPSVSWGQYANYANAVEGQSVEFGEDSDFESALGESMNPNYTSEESSLIIASLEVSGIYVGLEIANMVFSIANDMLEANAAIEQLLEFTKEAGIVIAEGAKPAEFAQALTELSKTKPELAADLAKAMNSAGDSAVNLGVNTVISLQALAITTISAFIGSLAGKYLADMLGIQGNAATVFTMASGVASVAIAKMMIPNIFGENPMMFNLFGFEGFAASHVLIGAAVVMAYIYLIGWGNIKIVNVKFSCLPWQAPSGGENCGKCNEDPLKPCTEYRCNSLGQACELINTNTNNPICVGMESEATPPMISPEEIKTQGYKFQNQETKKVEIRKDNSECIQEFTPVLFTLKTDEYAQCKWDLKHTANYESMTRYPAEGTAYTLNHTLAVEGLSLSILQANNVSGDIIEGLTGNMEMYVRCQDYFGNFNLNEYAVDFCINSGPDTTPVSHYSTVTSPQNEKFLSYGKTKTNFTMWMNEPAECKYDLTEGKNFNEMANSMNCKTNLTNRELFGWPCSTELTNLENENTFYIKCKDQPWITDENERNTNIEDFVYNLYLTESELNIYSISVLHDEVKTDLNQDTFTEIRGGGNMFSIELGVESSGGKDNGISLCSYQWNNNWIPFLNSNSDSHKQEFTLVNGNYNIPIKCVDDAENEITKNAKFILDVDHRAPMVVRTFHQSGKLKLITSEQAKCYSSSDSLKQCNFNIEDVEDMETGFSILHSTNWVSGQTHYIKCKDLWDNQNPGCAVKITTS
tara:strand:+ start:5210 stop:9055 length:3846 start_codon:yes stop_codon:yes gene_type:complete